MLHNDQPSFLLDVEREQRTGVSEAVFCLNKNVDQITEILEYAAGINHRLLLTRLSENKFKRLTPLLQQSLFYDVAAQVAILGDCPAPENDSGIAVVSGGSSDHGVCREVELTLAFHGVGSKAYYDVGVAGLWRLEQCLPALRECKVLVAVAGMEAALPTVVAGLVPAIVIAVPTSTGYGVSEHGKTALNACLASCASGIVTVNIDNGFGAACAALKIVKVAITPVPDIA